VILKKALGVNLDKTVGYSSSKEQHLPIVRCEFDLTVKPHDGALPFVREGLLRPILVINAERCPDLPDVPTVYEAAAGLFPEAKR
jgi:tripartite-type tricarboxylate transporter receptor subunit TctC